MQRILLGGGNFIHIFLCWLAIPLNSLEILVDRNTIILVSITPSLHRRLILFLAFIPSLPSQAITNRAVFIAAPRARMHMSILK